ncbi:MAG: peptide chain release factor N(5)-glutamine methyltransferase [Candidatus Komeilibacteria bacterium]
MPTIQAALEQAASILRAQSIDPGEADLLLSHVLEVDRSQLLMHPGQDINDDKYNNFINQVKERATGKPMAYIRGLQEFYGLKFKVNPDVLIPRPDSEVLIMKALAYLKDKKQASILDVGTGSGCLIITLACETNNQFNYFASDISAKALAVAKKNAIENNAAVTFIQSNLFNTFSDYNLQPTTYNLIVANLPYLTIEQLTEPSIKHEPELALHGGKQGLHFIRQLLPQLPAFTKSGSLVLLELDPSQKDIIESDIKQTLPDWDYTFYPDLSNRIRVLALSRQ